MSTPYLGYTELCILGKRIKVAKNHNGKLYNEQGQVTHK